MKLKKIYIYISFIIFSLTNITNSYSIEPDVFVQSTVNRASQVLSDSLSKDQKIEKSSKKSNKSSYSKKKDKKKYFKWNCLCAIYI